MLFSKTDTYRFKHIRLTCVSRNVCIFIFYPYFWETKISKVLKTFQFPCCTSCLYLEMILHEIVWRPRVDLKIQHARTSLKYYIWKLAPVSQILWLQIDRSVFYLVGFSCIVTTRRVYRLHSFALNWLHIIIWFLLCARFRTLKYDVSVLVENSL